LARRSRCRRCSQRRSCWGSAAQGVKISVDTTVQETSTMISAGRVFSVYDTVFNVMYVLAAVVGVFGLPDTGKSYGC